MHETLPEGVSRALLRLMLQAPETQRFECKRVSGKMVGKALETICAMANTEGGSLLLGMEDPAKTKGTDRLYGIGENPEAVDELLRKLESHLQPAVEDVKLQRLPCTLRDGTEGALLRIIVPRSDKVHSILEEHLDARPGKQPDDECGRNHRTVLPARCAQCGIGTG